jgi:hypothetical protein
MEYSSKIIEILEYETRYRNTSNSKYLLYHWENTQFGFVIKIPNTNTAPPLELYCVRYYYLTNTYRIEENIETNSNKAPKWRTVENLTKNDYLKIKNYFYNLLNTRYLTDEEWKKIDQLYLSAK